MRWPYLQLSETKLHISINTHAINHAAMDAPMVTWSIHGSEADNNLF